MNPNGNPQHPGKRSALAGISLFARYLYGGWFLFHGLNYWAEFYHDSSIEPGPGLTPALAESGLLAIVKLLEIVIGLALLFDLWAALAIVAAWPITLVIAFVTASHGKPFGIGVAIVIIALNGLMSLGHLDRYRPMLALSAGRPWSNAESGTDFDQRRLPLAVQLFVAICGLALAIAITYASLALRR